MQEFEVGSYVWFVRADRPGVYHYLVVEEIVKKSIDGTTRDYLFEAKSKKKTARIESKTLDGNYFMQRESAYKFMLEQAGLAINKMIDRAEYFRPTDVLSSQMELSSDTEGDTIVELPDGTKARLKGGIPK